MQSYKARVKCFGVLNVREKPGMMFDRVQRIPNGQVLTVTAQRDGWAYVHYGSVKGWVDMHYITPFTAQEQVKTYSEDDISIRQSSKNTGQYLTSSDESILSAENGRIDTTENDAKTAILIAENDAKTAILIAENDAKTILQLKRKAQELTQTIERMRQCLGQIQEQLNALGRREEDFVREEKK